MKGVLLAVVIGAVDWVSIDRAIALARLRTELDLILKHTRTEFETARKPAFVIICEQGGVFPKASHLASGSNCVGHDVSGDAFSAQAISVYDDSLAAP